MVTVFAEPSTFALKGIVCRDSLKRTTSLVFCVSNCQVSESAAGFGILKLNGDAV